MHWMQYHRNLPYVPKTKRVEDRTQPVNCITDNSTGTDLDLCWLLFNVYFRLIKSIYKHYTLTKNKETLCSKNCSCPEWCNMHDLLFIHKQNATIIVIVMYQRWSPRGRPRGHILKSLALASKLQVLENCPVLGSMTALFFELLKFRWKTPETSRKICEHLFCFPQLEHRRRQVEGGSPP